jgi:hypothetical protein
MDCCGRSRAAGRPGALPAVRRTSAPGGSATGSAPAVGGPVPLRWRRRVTAEVTGPASGRTYAVSAERPVVVVGAADAAGLLATGFFSRVG